MGLLWAKIAVGGTVSCAAHSHHPSAINAIQEMHRLETVIEGWAERYSAAHLYMDEHPDVTLAAIRASLAASTGAASSSASHEQTTSASSGAITCSFYGCSSSWRSPVPPGRRHNRIGSACACRVCRQSSQ